MAAPVNISVATATVIASLPASVTQTVHDAGTTYAVWYAYTATAADVWIGVWADGGLGAAYQPTITTWLAPGGVAARYLFIEATQVPIQVPVTPATTYYFLIAPPVGNPSPAVLTLSVVRGPAYDVAAGSIAVNDDTSGFPLIFLDSTTGRVLRAVHPFPAGEAGDTLASGVVAVNGSPTDGGSSNQITVYSPALVAVGPALSLPNNPGGTIRAHASGTFYVADDGANLIRTVTAAGTFGPTTWGPATGGASSLRALAVNPAQTIAYYADHQVSERAIKQWNLTSDTDGGVFHAFPSAAWVPSDILVLGDGTVLIGYGGGPGTEEALVKHLSPAGAELHSYPFTLLVSPDGTHARLASAAQPDGTTDDTAFWIWTHHADGLSRFRKIQISDGATLVTVEATEFEVGASQAPASATPARFGMSFSCPFWITRVDFPAVPPNPPPDVPPGGGEDEPPFVSPETETDQRYIRRLRRAPHVNNDNTRLFVRKFELDLERGQGLATGQGSDPIVMLRLSRDGGQTWGEEVRMQAGALGAYTQRVLARRLGHARDTVFEVTVSDPIAWSLVGAWLDIEGGTS